MSERAPGDRGVPEFVADLLRIGSAALRDSLGIDQDAAGTIMRKVADDLCTEYARRQIYVPAGFDARNRDIVRKYQQASRTARPCTQQRVHELAAEFTLTSRQIYSILRAQLAADFADRQGTLPGLDPAAE